MSLNLRMFVDQVGSYKGIWRFGHCVVLLFGGVGLAMAFRNWIGLLASVLWAYVIGWCLYVMYFPLPHYGLYTRSFQMTAGQVLAEVILIPLAVILTHENLRSWLWKALQFTVVWEVFCVMVHWNGLMQAPSFDTAFIALALPFVHWWIVVLGLIAIVTHHGSTALLILLVEAVAFAIHFKRVRWAMLALVPFAGALAYFHSLGPLLDGTERLQTYWKFYSIWNQDWWLRIFGVGPGSFMWFSLLASDFKPPMFLQMHSDWLQIIFELGLIGFALALAMWITAAYRAWGDARILAGVAGVAAFGLFYHPLRWAPPALLCTMIMYRALKTKRA